MTISSTLTNRSGQVLNVTYRDIETAEELAGKEVHAVHAYCFSGDKLVLVYSEKKGYWTPPGGGVEPGESAEEATIREVLEESNMKVLSHQFIGYQEIAEPNGIKRQTRSVCIVEPYGPFVQDPDGDIDTIELIEPELCNTYFDWGKIGNHVLARAVAMKDTLT